MTPQSLSAGSTVALIMDPAALAADFPSSCPGRAGSRGRCRTTYVECKMAVQVLYTRASSHVIVHLFGSSNALSFTYFYLYNVSMQAVVTGA